MKNRPPFRLIAAVCLLGVGITKDVSAQDVKITAGESAVTPGGVFQNVTSPFSFNIGPTINRSYCCTVMADSTEPYINEFRHGPGTQFLDITYRGSVEPLVVGDTSGASNFEHARACFIASVGSLSTATVHFGGQNGTDTADNVSVRCDETSLYGGYNTSAGEINYLEISNTTEASVKIRVIATNEFASGATALDQSFTLLANRRFDLAIHDAVPAGAFGSVRVLHDGPSGAISAAVSEYKIITVTPLNFQLVGRIKFEPRQ